MFIFKVTEPSPLQDSSGVGQKGDLLGHPHVVPNPESIAAQAAYAEALLPGSVPARIVSRHWGPPRACYFKFGATGSHIVNSVTPVTVVAAGSKLTSA